jgi:hypothetical protein
MIAKLKAYWHSHGTKVLGTITTVMGAMQTAIVTGLMEVPKGYKNAVALIVIGLGAATVRRGFTNTKNTPSA